DGVELDDFRVSEDEIKKARKEVDSEFIEAIRSARDNILKFHEAQVQKEVNVEISQGVQVSHSMRPLDSVGLYVPGGLASYPSSVLMVAIPALVAGVSRRILCTPPSKNGRIDPSILVASEEAKVTDIFKIGGAQAIAAMAFGTKTIPPVQKIVGPGNRYVTAAKILVQTRVGIDLPAGPSEILILADETSNPKYLTIDLLSQAEHDENATCILISTSEKVAYTTIHMLENLFDQFERREIMQKVLEENLYVIVAESLNTAVELANEIAPEHLEIQTAIPEEVLPQINNAGAIFLGPFAPVAIGDYSAGSNHVLPTGGTARFASGLSVKDFFKTIEIVRCDETGLRSLEKITTTIARKEGLTAHARSITERFMK
ncbi:MAG: histidinol dehydrogenase, partial [Candidatus Helarchaeales archaeon]